jgi:hypothetical protein
LKDAKITIEQPEPLDDAESCEMPVIVSETMAKLLVRQKKFTEAQKVYELLLLEKPEKSEYYTEQLSILLTKV